MKIISYYCLDDNSHFPFWQTHIGEALPKYIGDAVLVPITGNYEVLNDYFDIAYCQLYFIPKSRPAKFVYTFLSDYVGYEKMVKNWILAVKPNLICMLQELPQDLIDFANKNGCRVELLPWFIKDIEKPYQDRDILGFCSGCIKRNHYPQRGLINDYLKNKKFEGVILSTNELFGKYKFSNDEYIETLKRSRYYFSGGIYDRLIPPKYYEVCNHGCTLVSFDMPFMERCGFINGKTYIKLNKINDIDDILHSDSYLEIGRNAQKMVQEQHTIKNRANKILEIYEIMGNKI
jgi:hypothetical protein